MSLQPAADGIQSASRLSEYKAYRVSQSRHASWLIASASLRPTQSRTPSRQPSEASVFGSLMLPVPHNSDAAIEISLWYKQETLKSTPLLWSRSSSMNPTLELVRFSKDENLDYWTYYLNWD